MFSREGSLPQFNGSLHPVPSSPNHIRSIQQIGPNTYGPTVSQKDTFFYKPLDWDNSLEISAVPVNPRTGHKRSFKLTLIKESGTFSSRLAISAKTFIQQARHFSLSQTNADRFLTEAFRLTRPCGPHIRIRPDLWNGTLRGKTFTSSSYRSSYRIVHADCSQGNMKPLNSNRANIIPNLLQASQKKKNLQRTLVGLDPWMPLAGSQGLFEEQPTATNVRNRMWPSWTWNQHHKKYIFGASERTVMCTLSSAASLRELDNCDRRTVFRV